MRSGWNTVLVQYFTEPAGFSANPIAVNPTNDPTAVTAARRSPRSRKNRTKAIGVSLTAAARPTSTPLGQRGRDVRQSSATNAISSRLTCPKPSVPRTGSSRSATGSTARTRTSTSRSTTTSAATDSAVTSTPATGCGGGTSGVNSTAAIGG